MVTASSNGTVFVWDVRLGTPLRRLSEPSGSMRGAAFSPDGTRVVTVSEYGDGDAVVWDVRSGTALLRLEGHFWGPTSGVYAPDGARILTTSRAEAIVWDAVAGTALHQIDAGGQIGWAGWSPDGKQILTAQADGVAVVWDGDDGTPRFQVEGHVGSVDHAAFSPDGTRIVTASAYTVAVSDAASGALLHLLEGHEGEVARVAFSSDGKRILTVGPRSAALWDAAAGALLHRFGRESQQIWGAFFTPDGPRAVTVGRFGKAAMWDVATGERTLRLRGVNFFDASIAWSPEGDRLVLVNQSIYANETTTGGVWDTSTGTLQFSLDGRSRSVLSLVVSGDGRRIVTSTEDGATVWDTSSGRMLRRIEGRPHWMFRARLSPDGQRVLTSSEGTVSVWDTTTGRLRQRLEGHTDAISAAVFSPDGALIVSSSGDGSATVWNTATGRLQARLEGHEGPVLSAAFSPDGRRIATASEDRTVIVWDAERGSVVHRLEAATSGVLHAEFSSDGSRLVAATADGQLLVWDAGAGTLQHRLEGHDDVILSLALTPPGSHAVTASRDGTAIVWDIVTGQQARVLEGHDGTATSAAIAPEGSQIATGGIDGTAALWDARTGRLLRRLEGHASWVTAVAFSPDGTQLITAGYDGTTRLWDPRTGRALGSLLAFADGTWLVVDAEGRFDTADLGTLQGASWTRPVDPLRPLEVTTFARDFYVPGLLAELWRGRSLPEVPDLLDTNIVTPTVSLRAEPDGPALRVDVEVCDQVESLPTQRGTREYSSGAEDLRVFLDDRLVFWRDGSLGSGCTTHSATVTPPRGANGLTLTAHAFNVARVKSETARVTVSHPGPHRTPTQRAYLVHVGVDAYAGKGLDPLSWAGTDAQALATALASIPDHRVTAVLLTQGGHAAPTRDHLRQILAALAGEGPAPSWAPDVAVATPDDLVLISFSGHGYAPEGGPFYLMLDDSARTDALGIEGALPFAVSEHELSAWLRPVEAGEMALIVDACQSAATVQGEGFRPGPLGSKGFGQLAYDKGMLVLAASQSDGVALESSELQHGLLTWALVYDGLEAGLADTDGERGITLREWLDYAETRVPELAGAVARGEIPDRVRAVRQPELGKKGLEDLEGPVEAPLAQQPRLFAFKRAGHTPVRSLMDDPRVSLVRELLGSIGSTEAANQAVQTDLELLVRRLRPTPDLEAQLRSAVTPETLAAWAVPVYLKYLDEPTLQAAVAFYRSPAGRAYAGVRPADLEALVHQGEGTAHEQAAAAFLRSPAGRALLRAEPAIVHEIGVAAPRRARELWVELLAAQAE